MSWANAGLAGAFVLGAIAGVFACTRITKMVMEYVRRNPPDGR